MAISKKRLEKAGQCHLDNDIGRSEAKQKNEHIGDGVLVSLKKGMANKQAVRLPKKTIQEAEIMLLYRGSQKAVWS